MAVQVAVYDAPSSEEFVEEIAPRRRPAVLRGLDVGPCTRTWGVGYLSERAGAAPVRVHVSPQPCLDFRTKNFSYATMTLGELLSKASAPGDNNNYYYLRSLGVDPRAKDPADLTKQFPQVSEDVRLPRLFPEESFFSSVLRVSSPGLRLWTHYDVMDNVLLQVLGEKRVLLFPPQDALRMYLEGDKSRVLDVDAPDPLRYPLFLGASRHECLLRPGDALFIPALWFHNTLALDFGVAVNVFWRHLPPQLYDAKDPYGNRDVLPAARALLTVNNAVKALDGLPEDHRDFYVRRMIAFLEKKLTPPRDETPG